MDEAAGDHTVAARPRRERLASNRRAQQELIRKNRRRAAEARQRPGSNVPPADAGTSRDRVRADVAAILDRAEITHPGQRLLWQELIAARRAYQSGGNTAETAVWMWTAVCRFLEPPGSTLHDIDALLPMRVLLNALREALAGNLAPVRAMLPERETLEGAKPLLSTGGCHRACAAAGVMGLWGAQRGGVTQNDAKELVSKAFDEAGISITPGSALEFFKRIRRGDDTVAVLDMYAKLTADLPASRPLPERKAWLKRLADAAGRILEM
jgi:hypothetical protein